MLVAEIHPLVQSLEHLLGFFLVLLALGMLFALTFLLGQFFKDAGVVAAPAPATPSVADSPESLGSEPSEEEVVAIAASVSLLLGKRSRVVSIRSSTKDWNREGRREHFASHRIR